MPLGLKFKNYFTFRGLEKVGILLHKCQQMLFIVHFKPDSIKGHDITWHVNQDHIAISWDSKGLIRLDPICGMSRGKYWDNGIEKLCIDWECY